MSFVIDRTGAAAPPPDAELPIDVEKDVEEAQREQKGAAASRGDHKKRPRAKRPAWVDEDDEGPKVSLVEHRRTRKFRKKMGEKQVDAAEYEERLRHFYETKVAAGGTTQWAQLPPNDDDDASEKSHESEGEGEDDDNSDSDDDDDFTARLTQLSSKSGASNAKTPAATASVRGRPPLRAGVLRCARKTDLTKEARHKAIVHSVDFHPTGRLALTSGLDRAVRIFQVDGTTNARVHGAWLKEMRVACAAFTGGGHSVVISGLQKHLYRMDLQTGHIARHRGVGAHRRRTQSANDVSNTFAKSADGTLLAFPTVDGRTTVLEESKLHVAGALHVPGRLAALCFDPSNKCNVLTLQRDGVVRLWDTRMWACIDAHRDTGTVHGTRIACSGGHYAVGSDVGVVNIYERSSLGAFGDGLSKIRDGNPVKEVTNLTTAITDLSFNGDGKLLAMASRECKDAVKMLHVPSLTVYANWPPAPARIGLAQCSAFSPGGGWFACGNDAGAARLYRLASYPAN